ncbi:MAG TPA: hypothetical protein P5137_17440, partial [Candidatus Brocadiia bacterium]|nr:hypothetical protein [Candidatus Brocadiia bacterium]
MRSAPGFLVSAGRVVWRFRSSDAGMLARMEGLLASHKALPGGEPTWDVWIETQAPPLGLEEDGAEGLWRGTFADGRPLRVRRVSRSRFEARVSGGGRVWADAATGQAAIELSAETMATGQGRLGECFLALLQLAMAESGRFTVHAGCVARDGRALLLLGESGAGKTTLSLALGRQGWAFMGDDIVLVENRGGQAVVHALLLPAKILRPDGGKDLLTVEAMHGMGVAREAVIAGVARLSRDGQGRHELVAVDRRQVLLWMLEQGNDPAMYGEAGAEWFGAAAAVAETA